MLLIGVGEMSLQLTGKVKKFENKIENTILT